MRNLGQDRRIAVLLPNLRHGGTEQVRLLLAEEFVRRGYRVDFVLGQAEGALLDRIPRAARVIDLDAPRVRQILPRLVGYLRRERPDYLLASVWPLTAIAATARLVAATDTKVVLSEHSHLSRVPDVAGASRFLLRKFGRFFYRSADRVITVSNGVRQDLCEQTGLGPDEVGVVYNGVRRPPADPAPTDDAGVREWRETKGLRIITIGSLIDAKNFPNLIRAVALLSARGFDPSLLILGEGPRRADLERLASELGIGPRLRLGGYRPNVYAYLAASDLYVLSSDWEGLPGALIEALASGVPVVATDCPSGPAEVLAGGRFGRLVPVGDPQALADAIAEEVRNPLARPGLGEHLAQFTIENAADRYLAALGGA